MSVFSDWSVASWQEDLDDARAQALAWLESTATAKKWPSAATDHVRAVVEAAAESADGWWSDDVTGFWSSVAAGMDRYAGKQPESWAKLRAAYASASGAADTVAEGREQGSVATVLGGTVAATAEDVATVAEVAKTSGWKWALGGLFVLGGIYVAAKGSR